MATKKEVKEVEEIVKEELDGRAGQVDKWEFESNTYPFEMVKRFYYKGRAGKDADDIYVCINGKGYLVQRGVEVEIPYFVAQAIENAEKMTAKADEFVQELIDATDPKNRK